MYDDHIISQEEHSAWFTRALVDAVPPTWCFTMKIGPLVSPHLQTSALPMGVAIGHFI
jgi:hypothetical protein